jgi:hypothetical protein
MFKGVSQCMPTVGVLYFGLFNPFHNSPPPLYPPRPHFSTAFNTHPCILYLHKMSCFMILLTLYHSLFLPLLPQLHSVAPLLRTCSRLSLYITMLVLCVYVYLWIYHV